MPQHVHTDQEECMLVLRATGSQPIFRFSSHSVDLQDETLIHVFPGDYHGFVPEADSKIAIVALYLVPSSNAGVKMEPMSPKDIALWKAVAGS
jgi:cupin superfamily acireductone dioxygenase involved in methionine salvage